MKTTFSRIFFPAAIILLTALLLVGISFQALVRDYLETKVLDSLKNDCATISEVAAAYYTEDALTDRDFLFNLSVAAQVSGADAVICDANGRLLLCSDAPLGCEHQGWVITSQNYVDQVVSSGFVASTGLIQGLYSDARYVVATPIAHPVDGRTLGLVIVSQPLAATLSVLKRLSNTYLAVSVLVVLISVIIMTFYTRRQTAPLRDMAQAASAFGHGDLRARVKVSEDDPQEVQELALAFNNMASSLEKSEYQRKEFVANVSHELKTPMTTIGGYVDGILDGTIPAEKQQHYMQIVSDETKRLSRLVRSMLDISRLQDQDGIPESQKTRFDLTECAGRVLITFEQKITAKGVTVEVDMPEYPVYTNASEDAITQVIYNLLDNAVKFCPADGVLGLQIREAANKIYVTVSNDGDTIPPEELPLVFDRFHKLDKSRTQNRDGWGLGLYIVRTLVSRHGENISVSSANGKTAFTFTLPFVT